MNDIVERLLAVPLYESYGEESSLPEQAADAIEALQARIRLLEDALRPFGKLAFYFENLEDNGGSVMASVFLSDLRRARDVLKGEG